MWEFYLFDNSVSTRCSQTEGREIHGDRVLLQHQFIDTELIAQETGVSTYDKPDELKSNDEKEAPQCAWKEFTAPGGKKYYYNSLTKKVCVCVCVCVFLV